MKTRTLGMTGLQVSEIGLGAFPISGMWQRPDGSNIGWTGIDDRESIVWAIWAHVNRAKHPYIGWIVGIIKSKKSPPRARSRGGFTATAIQPAPLTGR